MRTLECELERVNDRMPNPWSRVKDIDEFWGDLGRQSRWLLKTMLEDSMLAWRSGYVGAEWHEKSPDGRADRCNGFYVRKRWVTPMGPFENVRVPRCRNAGLTEQMKSKVGNGLIQVADQVIEMFLAGVSTRRVGEILQRIIGLPVSAAAVSSLTRKLDGQARTFHSRPLVDEYAYLLLDGVYLKARGEKVSPTRRRKCQPRRRIVLVAYGVTRQGVKELIAFQAADSESADVWESFLWNLYGRGLRGEQLRLLITDGGGGLKSAVERVYPMVARQSCWFHKLANLAKYVRKADWAECLQGLRTIYQASRRSAAMQAYRSWSARWRRRCPKAVACLAKDIESLLSFFATPKAHWKMVRTTNAIERCFRELRRRTDSVGTFLDDASINRLVYALFAYMNLKRAGKPCAEFRRSQLAA